MPGESEHSVHPVLNELLHNLSGKYFDTFCSSPTNSFFLYRLLDPLSQSIVCRLLWLKDEINFANLKGWYSPDKFDQFSQSLNLLKRLSMLHGKEGFVQLNGHFQTALESFFTTPSDQPMRQQQQPVIREKQVNEHECFQNILYFLINQSGSDSSKHPSKLLVDLFLSGGLLNWSNEGDSFQITSRGFQFVLRDRPFQLWTLLIEFLKQFRTEPDSYLHILELFVLLSFHPVEQEIQFLDKDLQFQELLLELGIIYKSTRLYKHNDTYKWLFAKQQDQTASMEDRFIILETNYKLYAYTTNPLHISILSLFCTIRGSFPNMTYAILNGEKLKNAFSKGITSEQVLNYLETHIHRQLKQKDQEGSPLIPATLSDQIRLWELEKFRLKMQSVVCYSDFESSGQFENAVSFAESGGFLILANKTKRLLVISSDSHDKMKQFFKQQSR